MAHRKSSKLSAASAHQKALNAETELGQATKMSISAIHGDITELEVDAGAGAVGGVNHEAAGGIVAGTKRCTRFASEMRMVGGLNHPNIVGAHDAREVDGVAIRVRIH